MTFDSTTDLAHELVTRRVLLAAVGHGAADANDLAADIDASVSTVNRVVSAFVDEGALERTDAGITRTAYGATLAHETERFTQSVETARRLRPLLEQLVVSPIEYDLAWFLDAEVSEACPATPYAPLERYSELFAGSSSKRILGDRFVVPEYGVEAAAEAMAEGIECLCVWSERALERMVDRYPRMIEWSADQENLEGWVADDVPFDLAIFDDHLLVYTFDPDSGAMSVLVDTDDPDAVEWGTAVFEDATSKGDPIDVEGLDG